MCEKDIIFRHCLYYTANALARVITRMADEEFAMTGISPCYAFLMMLVSENPGIVQKDLSEALHLAPSTVTRFIDKLERRGVLARRTEGRTTRIYPTDEGRQLQKIIDAAWYALYVRYNEILGKEDGEKLAEMIHEAVCKLEA